MMISSGGQLKCRKCGYIRKIEVPDKMKIQKMRTENEIKLVEPRYTTLNCPNCGSDHTTICRGPHNIPNPDYKSVENGNLVECDQCGKSWFIYGVTFTKSLVTSYVTHTGESWTRYSYHEKKHYDESSETTLDELNQIDKGNVDYS